MTRALVAPKELVPSDRSVRRVSPDLTVKMQGATRPSIWLRRETRRRNWLDYTHSCDESELAKSVVRVCTTPVLDAARRPASVAVRGTPNSLQDGWL